MKTATERDDVLSSFIPFAAPQKDFSLLIASHTPQQETLEKILLSLGFMKADKALTLFRSIREATPAYIVLDKSNAKDIYDLAAQYPTGQVSILNKEYPEIVWTSPDYREGAVIILCTKKMVEEVASLGLDMRMVTGIAFQE